MINIRGREGYFIFRTKTKDGIIKEETVYNRLMDSAINAEIDILRGIAPDQEIKYIAVGTGTTPIANNQTQLANEVFRFIPSNPPTRTATGEIVTEFVILENEAQIEITEIGIFCGTTATATLNSGNMLSRVLWDFDKRSNIELSITRVDRIVRG
jgi:hypothetical protein